MACAPCADLFCGGGGMTRALREAARKLGIRLEMWALNHWNLAIMTHSRNHPDVRHLLADIEGVEPRRVVPGGYLRALTASPECIYFSKARGGKPINDQRRSSADYVLQWARELVIDDILLENVEEFEHWGPLYPDDHPNPKLRLRPIPERRGEEFQRFVGELRAMGYRVEWRTLCAASYGDATSRKRFFLRARLGNKPITWPAPTHARSEWRPASEIIDFSARGASIYGRKKPLAPATMRRIYVGLQKFSGLAPFLVEYHGSHAGTCSGDGRVRGVDIPLPTQDTSNRFGLALPYMVVLRNHADSLPVDATVPTICAEGQHLGVAQPYLINMKGKSNAADVMLPLPTQTAHAAHLGVIQPYLTKLYGGHDACSVDAPLPTITANYQHFGLTQPFLTKYYGTGGCQTVESPLDTVTTKDRFGLAQPSLLSCDEIHSSHLLEALTAEDPLYHPRVAQIDGMLYLIDIFYRMLFPRELALAMGFPPEYFFAGAQDDQVRQIGNAVPVYTATALCLSMLQ